jgi:hypothetical protein
MPTKTFKKIAKKSGKTVADMERYWTRARQSYNKAQSRAKAGKRKPVKDKHSYMMATTLRQAQGTGSNPHTPLGGKKKKKKKGKSKKEAFINKIDNILEGTEYNSFAECRPSIAVIVEEFGQEYTISEGKMWDIAKRVWKLVRSGGKAVLSFLAAHGIKGVRPLMKILFKVARKLVGTAGETLLEVIDLLLAALDKNAEKAMGSLIKIAKGKAEEGWMELKAQIGGQEAEAETVGVSEDFDSAYAAAQEKTSKRKKKEDEASQTRWRNIRNRTRKNQKKEDEAILQRFGLSKSAGRS